MPAKLQMLDGRSDSATQKMKNKALSHRFKRTAIPAKCYENVVIENFHFQP